MDAILSNLDKASNSRLKQSPTDIGRGAIVLDHAHRIAGALAGFRVYRGSWLCPWMTYCASPILSRVAPAGIARFTGFNTRLGEGDLYTFANVFADYPIDDLARALPEVELIVDLGANVGAFSFLMRTLCRKIGSNPRIVALEPDAANAAFLRGQPFADALEIHQAAVGRWKGKARLVAGKNSVTHHVDFSGNAEGQMVPVMSLESLCDRPTLVKMDIEGGEFEVLGGGLPENVRHLVLEWHHSGGPADLVPGNWTHITSDIHGSSIWYLRR
jgi:FkbM family methyltransferase